jgi:hypothetical protein
LGLQDAIAATANSVANSIANQSDSSGISPKIVSAIKNAAAKTGVDFSYLMQKAAQESGFNPTAKASTSSATGLFQFTGQTWLQMVKNNGAQYGLGAYSSQITTDASGHLSISDPATKKAILDLRNDPTISAEMAGELDKQNAASLQQNVGGTVGSTELYLAHFLGAGGANDFISAMRSNPNGSAAAVLPDAAAANSSVFYSKTGQPRTLSQIYQHFAAKFDNALSADGMTPAATATQVASVSPLSAAAISMTAKLSVPQAATQLASLYTPASSASPSTSVSVAGVTSLSGGSASATTSTASTLFTAMMLGQMNGAAFETAQSRQNLYGASDSDSEGRKKNSLSDLSSIAA